VEGLRDSIREEAKEDAFVKIFPFLAKS